MINDNFSLMKGGPVYRMLHALGASKPGSSIWVALLLVLVSTGPIIALCARSGTLWGANVTMPLLHDYAAAARFLLAIPLLVLAAPNADALLKRAIRQMSASSLVRRGRQHDLDAIIEKIGRLRDSNVPELICFLLALLPSLLGLTSLDALPGITDWRIQANGTLTAAAQWFNLVSIPIFRFVGAIWLWRFCLWTYLLWRLSRIELILHPAHPDGAGGIGFVGVAQERFAVLALAGGILLCGAFINHIVYLGESPGAMRYLIAIYVAGVTTLLLAPLLLLAPAMFKAKRNALRDYDAMGVRMVRVFDRRWRKGLPGEDTPALIDQADASSLADFTGVYNTLNGMSVFPLTRWNVLWIVLPALAPFLPLVFLAMSIDELAQKLFSLLV